MSDEDGLPRRVLRKGRREASALNLANVEFRFPSAMACRGKACHWRVMSWHGKDSGRALAKGSRPFAFLSGGSSRRRVAVAG